MAFDRIRVPFLAVPIPGVHPPRAVSLRNCLPADACCDAVWLLGAVLPGGSLRREIWRACGFWRQVRAHICLLRPCQNGGALLLRSDQAFAEREPGNFDKSCVIESRLGLGLLGPLISQFGAPLLLTLSTSSALWRQLTPCCPGGPQGRPRPPALRSR